MTRGFDKVRARHDTTWLLELETEHRRHEDGLWSNGRLRGRRHADPIVLDAQSRGIAVFDVLLCALDCGNKDEGQSDRRNAHTNGAADRQ